MIYHSNPPYGDIQDGQYTDSKKRLWQCCLCIGRLEPKTKGITAEVEMKHNGELKIVTPQQFREFTHKQQLIKVK